MEEEKEEVLDRRRELFENCCRSLLESQLWRVKKGRIVRREPSPQILRSLSLSLCELVIMSLSCPLGGLDYDDAQAAQMTTAPTDAGSLKKKKKKEEELVRKWGNVRCCCLLLLLFATRVL